MWTCENRPKYNRDKLRYPSDLTDEPSIISICGDTLDF